ncbi:UvrD-helicase domain-containing protein [Calditrichota bacterium]
MAKQIQFTSAQEKALDVSSGKIVLAGAGSGKTTALTARYIRLLELGLARPAQIASVTFTNKAAAQLFSRIETALLDKENSDAERSEEWRKFREELAWSKIGTIHKLCASLLRLFPYEAGVDPEFSVDNITDPVLVEIIHQYVGSLAVKRDPNLDFILDSIGSRAQIEELLLKIIIDRILRDAILAASEKPNEAEQYLDSAAALLQNQICPVEEIIAGNHSGFVKRLGILAKIVKPLEKMINRRGTTLTFDDLEQYTLRLLKNHPEVVSKIKNSLHYLFVDEFQDNSPIQWEIIQLLAANVKDEFDPDRLFLVGDEKQSIYGFRGADVTVARHALLKMTGEGDYQKARESSRFVNLNDNFRSLPALVNPLNEVFKRLFEVKSRILLPFEAEAQPLTPHRQAIQVSFPECEIALGYKCSDEEMANWLAWKIESVLGSEIPSKDGEYRQLEPSDIAILLRSRTRLGTIEQSLTNRGIPFQSIPGDSFFDLQEVRDLYNLLLAIADPRDTIALAGILRSPMFNISDPALSAIILAAREPLKYWSMLADRKLPSDWNNDILTDEDFRAINFSYNFFKELKNRSRLNHPAELLHYALEETGAIAAYAAGKDADQRLANIDRFIELVRQTSGSGSWSIRKLVTRLGDLSAGTELDSDSISDISMGKGVKILTIHSAKGLEFPFVILADLATDPRRSSGQGNLLAPPGEFYPLTNSFLANIGVDPDEHERIQLHEIMQEYTGKAEDKAEMKRLMYVAATRAKDRLMLVSPIKTSKNGIPRISEKSHLFHWLDAFGIKVNEDGTFSNPETPGISKPTAVTKEMCAAISRKDVFDSDIMPDFAQELKNTPAETELPGISIVKPPRHDQLVLSFSALSEYLAREDEESFEKLVYGSSLENPDGFGFDHGEQTGAYSRETPSFNSAAVVGSLLHRLYQVYGPGCSWTMVATEVNTWIQNQNYHANEVSIDSIKMLIENGEKMRLGKLGSNSLRETPLTLQIGNVILRGNADLIVFSSDIPVIYDYKTNKISHNEIEEIVIRNGYDHQVKLYSLALLKAWKLNRVRSKLAFLACAEFSQEYEVESSDLDYYTHVVNKVNNKVFSEISSRSKSS